MIANVVMYCFVVESVRFLFMCGWLQAAEKRVKYPESISSSDGSNGWQGDTDSDMDEDVRMSRRLAFRSRQYGKMLQRKEKRKKWASRRHKRKPRPSKKETSGMTL